MDFGVHVGPAQRVGDRGLPTNGTRASRKPSLSATAARKAGNAANPNDAKLASSVIRICGIKGREADAAVKPPPNGTRASRNPSLSATAARKAGDDATPKDAKLASSVIRVCGIKGREAAAAAKPPHQGNARLAQSSLSANAK